MTTFTLKDYIDNMYSQNPTELSKALDNVEVNIDPIKNVTCSITSPVSMNVEPIPFAGYVNIQDKEDTEQMLRDQLHLVRDQLLVMQAENQRLKRKLRALGENE